MLKLLLVGIGGFLGAIARYGLTGWVHGRYGGGFPAGTLLVNGVGCLAIGAVAALIEQRMLFSPYTRLLLVYGLLGGFTTFSSFGYETFELLRAGSLRLAALNTIASVTTGVAAVWLGHALTRAAVLNSR